MNENYYGKTCPFCKTVFKVGDDIVLCSNCEMPHHKDCWVENQGCTTFGCTGTITSAGENFLPVNSGYANNSPQVVCASCGAYSNASNKFCIKCGGALNNTGYATQQVYSQGYTQQQYYYNAQPQQNAYQSVQQPIQYTQTGYVNHVNYAQPAIQSPVQPIYQQSVQQFQYQQSVQQQYTQYQSQSAVNPNTAYYNYGNYYKK